MSFQDGKQEAESLFSRKGILQCVGERGDIVIEYFKPWRRKIGCVTLVIACVVMGGWCRSMHFYNKLIFPVGAHAELLVVSTNQFVVLGFEFDEGRSSSWDLYEYKVEDTLPLNSTAEEKACNPLSYVRNFEWTSHWNAFWIGGNFDELPSYWLLEWSVPYWSATIPFTVISLWLFLVKPRKSNHYQTPEPTTIEGA